MVLPPDHRLAGRGEVRMAELAGEQFISFRDGARLRELLMAAGPQAGFEPRVKLEPNESQRIRRLVSRGMGVAVLPRSDAEAPGRRRRGGNADRAVVDPGHHAGLAGGAPAFAGGGRVPRACQGSVRARWCGAAAA